jgi:hypothetical protein
VKRYFPRILLALTACEGDAEKAVRQKIANGDAVKIKLVTECSADATITRGNVDGMLFVYTDGEALLPTDLRWSEVAARCLGR